MIISDISPVQAAVSAVCGIASLFFITANGNIFVKRCILKQDSPSCAPFIGGLAGGVAVLLAVEEKWRFLAFIPAVIDWGSIPAVCRFLWVFARDILENRRR